ncbi:MAG: hypothetical protein KC493_07695 [Bacteriovoracaceae bacterium]|nr:hypothetical protein [Bacteriovoracaceae bacterium]
MNVSELEVHIEFGRKEEGGKPFTLIWDVMDTPVTPFWIKYFTHCLKNNVFFKPRFMGFIDGDRNPEFLTKKINECIDTINKDKKYLIDKKLEGEFTQEYSNYIHHHFEVLIGDQWKKTQYWEEATLEVKSAVLGLNDYAHELEAWQRSTQGRNENPDFTMSYVLTEFYESPGMDIKGMFEDEFTLNTDFGDMTLHYAQIGKTWMEVCIDEDEDIFDPAIQPLWRLTGSFNIMFHEVDVPTLQKQVDAHLIKLGKDPKDPSLCLGLVPIAKLRLAGKSKEEIVKDLSNNQDIAIISLVNDGKEIIKNKFPPKVERYFIQN